MSKKNTSSKNEDLYVKKKDVVTYSLNGVDRKVTYIDTLRRKYKSSKADNMLLDAKTAEETKKALELGANPNAEREVNVNPEAKYTHAEYFVTPLMLARTAEQTKLLIDAGADVNLGAGINAINEKGYTPIMFARTQEQAILLLKAGARPEDLSKNTNLSKNDKTKILTESENKTSPNNSSTITSLLPTGRDDR